MRLAVPLIAILVTTCACHNTTTTPTTPTTSAFITEQFVTGILSPQASQVNTFDVGAASTGTVEVVSLVPLGSILPVDTPLKLAVGTPVSGDPSACTATSTVTAPPSLTPQITQQLLNGTYCVQVTDPGTLSADATFVVRVTESFNAPPIGTSGTQTFSSNVYPAGTSTRTFPASVGGQLTIRLTQIAPSVSVGFALGTAGSSHEDCSLFKAIVTQPGVVPEISAPAEAGTYCVKLWDTGQLTGRTQFEVQISHP